MKDVKRDTERREKIDKYNEREHRYFVVKNGWDHTCQPRLLGMGASRCGCGGFMRRSYISWPRRIARSLSGEPYTIQKVESVRFCQHY